MYEVVYSYACQGYTYIVMIKWICEKSLRYDAQKEKLYAASLQDPCFKTLPSLSSEEPDKTFSRLQSEAAAAAHVFFKG